MYIYVCETESLCYDWIFFFFLKKEEVWGRLEVWGDGRRFELGIAENKRGTDENKLGIFGSC